MSDLPRRLAQRFYTALPEPLQGVARAARARLLYPLNTRGLAANAEMRAWFAENARPFSIVIPSYNDVPLLSEALKSIERTCAGMEYEVIIVDDFIDPDVQRALREFESDRVRVVYKTERKGFAGTVNVGMELARHDIILLNSDIVAQDGWLEALQYSAYALDEKIGMVSPMLVFPEGRIQYAGTYYARLLAPQWFGHLHVGSPATRPTANVAGYNASISGACVYITRDAFERVGLLDDEFWLGFEDVDYGLRAWAEGVRCYYQPAALLIHHESASRGYSQGYRELASMRRFWRRWESRYLARRLSDDEPIRFVVSDETMPLWRQYAQQLADHLVSIGRDAAVVSRDEAEQFRSGILVACDWQVAESVWLAAAEGSVVPIYLMPMIESGRYPDDPALQAKIVAGYRPEFEYVVPHRHAQQLLRAETAWESRLRLAPALPPEPLRETVGDGVVVVGASPVEIADLESALSEVGTSLEVVPVPRSVEDLERLRERDPRVLVSLLPEENSLRPLALMSLGAVYVAPSQPALSHEVLDGYNALLFAPGDTRAMVRSVKDALAHEDVSRELRTNGWASAERAANAARALFADGLAALTHSPAS